MYFHLLICNYFFRYEKCQGCIGFHFVSLNWHRYLVLSVNVDICENKWNLGVASVGRKTRKFDIKGDLEVLVFSVLAVLIVEIFYADNFYGLLDWTSCFSTKLSRRNTSQTYSSATILQRILATKNLKRIFFSYDTRAIYWLSKSYHIRPESMLFGLVWLIKDFQMQMWSVVMSFSSDFVRKV